MNYVIIGNSVAAVGAVRGIRNIDPQGNITVISRERQSLTAGRSSHTCSADW